MKPTSGCGVIGERKYRGVTYWVTKKNIDGKEGWYNSVQTKTGMVENGSFANEYTAEVDAHDTINSCVK